MHGGTKEHRQSIKDRKSLIIRQEKAASTAASKKKKVQKMLCSVNSVCLPKKANFSLLAVFDSTQIRLKCHAK